MKIFIISRGFPSEKSPQWGCFEKDQAEALAAYGHEVVMISVDTRFRLYMRRCGFTIRHHNNVTSVDLYVIPSAIVGLLGRRIREKVEARLLNRVFKKAQRLYGTPDILYSHYLFISFRSLFLKNHYNIPLVAVEHWSDVNHTTLSKTVRRLGDNTYPQIDALVAVADSLRKAIATHFGIQATVVHNLFGQEFHYKEVERNWDKVRFVSTGSLIQRKGFDLLIKALHQADFDSKTWELTIIGEGEKRKELESLISQYNLQQQIHLVGQKNKDAIAATFLQNDIFILPSRNENFSVAVLEALACGLPVIASICGGIRECIDERNGVLFPVDDQDSLCKALKHIYNNFGNYSRKQIADDCQQRFGSKTIAKQLTQVFESVISRKP